MLVVPYSTIVIPATAVLIPAVVIFVLLIGVLLFIRTRRAGDVREE